MKMDRGPCYNMVFDCSIEFLQMQLENVVSNRHSCDEEERGKSLDLEDCNVLARETIPFLELIS